MLHYNDRMKSRLFIVPLLLAFWAVSSLSVIHAAVHFFHAEDSSHHSVTHFAENIQHPVGAHHQLSLETWICDIYDTVTSQAVYLNEIDVLLTSLFSSPGLVVVAAALVSIPLYPSFWSRAPPAYFV